MSNVEFDCEIGFRGHERSYDASVEWYAIKVPDTDCLPCHSYPFTKGSQKKTKPKAKVNLNLSTKESTSVFHRRRQRHKPCSARLPSIFSQ